MHMTPTTDARICASVNPWIKQVIMACTRMIQALALAKVA